MPYKRFSRVAWTFSIPQICPDFSNLEFFNSQGVYTNYGVIGEMAIYRQ